MFHTFHFYKNEALNANLFINRKLNAPRLCYTILWVSLLRQNIGTKKHKRETAF